MDMLEEMKDLEDFNALGPEIQVSDVECIKVLRLRPGDILVVDPNRVYRLPELRRVMLGFRVPVILADPEGFGVIRFDDGS